MPKIKVTGYVQPADIEEDLDGEKAIDEDGAISSAAWDHIEGLSVNDLSNYDFTVEGDDPVPA